MSVFDERVFNMDETAKIKNVVNDTIEALNSINDLNEHIKESVKDLCDALNEGVEHTEQKIKPSTITKMAKAKMKEDLDEQKDRLSEVEDGLGLIFGR